MQGKLSTNEPERQTGLLGTYSGHPKTNRRLYLNTKNLDTATDIYRVGGAGQSQSRP